MTESPGLSSASPSSSEAPPSAERATDRLTADQLQAAAAVQAHALASEVASPVEVVREYDRLRSQLEELWSAPVRDMSAIDAVMTQLDESHAAFKAQHSTGYHQRY